MVRTKALARCDSQLRGTPPEGWDLAAQPRAAAEEPARNHGKALAQTGAAYRQEQKMSEATFTGRSVLVTGATRGIGQVIAPGFGRRGGHLLAAGRDRERGENVAGQKRNGVRDDAST